MLGRPYPREMVSMLMSSLTLPESESSKHVQKEKVVFPLQTGMYG